ncbi:MAG: hypothetical protein FWH29_04325 [Methanobrevibacter sp.]|nr:hypothetical protein [Methanobrevibacter sp.]
MFKNLNPEIKKVIDSKTNLISTFSTGSKLNVLKIAGTGDTKVLKQTIEYIGLGGDY